MNTVSRMSLFSNRIFYNGVLFFLLIVFVQACSNGGALTNQENHNTKPVADAGSDQTVFVGKRVYLNGSNSYDPDTGDTILYSWSIIASPSESTAVIDNSNAENTTFTTDVTGRYEITLTVNDGTFNSLEATVVITSTDLDPARQLSQFGITWTFDKEITSGQFANGDFWVIGPVTIESINPASVVQNDGRIVNGSMINPDPSKLTKEEQGYDSAMYLSHDEGFYKSDLNAARPNDQDLSEINPLVVQPGSSLVSTISNENITSQIQTLRTASVLTVLDEAPAENSFRPSYCGSNKTILFNKTDIDYSVLKSLNPVSSSVSLSSLENAFEKPWLDYIGGWRIDYMHPLDNMPCTGNEIAKITGDAALSLMLNYTTEEKETLLIRFIQTGLDLYGIAINNGKWHEYQTGLYGRKLPIVFAGKILNKNNYSTNLMNVANAADYFIFHEDRQTFFVTDDDVGRVLSQTDSIIREQYISEDVGIAEWGVQHTIDKRLDDKTWKTEYRQSVGHSLIGHILAIHMLEAVDDWNWSALFKYSDRLMANDEDVSDQNWKGTRFSRQMWTQYRGDYTL